MAGPPAQGPSHHAACPSPYYDPLLLIQAIYRERVMASPATTAFQPAPEHAVDFGPPLGFAIQFSNSHAHDFSSVMAGLKREARLRADVPASLCSLRERKTWMPRRSPGK